MKVRYYGHIGERSGYGVAAREMCRALVTAGIDLEIRPLERRVMLEILDGGSNLPLASYLRPPSELEQPDIVIVHTLPLDCSQVLAHAIAEELEHHDLPWVAYTTWECMNAPPAIHDALSRFDQVWTPSKASALALMNHIELATSQYQIIPFAEDRHRADVHVMPHAYDVESIHLDGLAHDGPYRFLYVGAWTSRKNPSGLLRAFAHAGFRPDEAEIWMHSAGTSNEAFAIAHAQTGCHTSMARVRFLYEPLSWHLMLKQYRAVDCFVTASRGEAWNLPAFEAMLHRRHVIAPSPAGSDDFLIGTSAKLVDRGMASPAGVDVSLTSSDGKSADLRVIGAQGISSRSLWWEPDLFELAKAMRDAVDNQRRHLSLQYNPADRYSYEAVGKLALKHLEDL